VGFSYDRSKDITIRACSSNKVLPPLQGHTDPVNSVAFSPDDSKIVSGSDDETVRLWDVGIGEKILPPLRGQCPFSNSPLADPH
jgi:WD40 repeat protein